MALIVIINHLNQRGVRMDFDYRKDVFGRACLHEAIKSKGNIGFGAILLKDGEIIGRGWNRRSIKRERKLLSHVDYGIHAEQACVVDALRRGVDIRHSIIYVLGIALRGPHRGKLTTRRKRVLVCKKCPPSILLRFNISVMIPHISGWVELSPENALQTAEELCGDSYWKKFLEQATSDRNARV